MPCLRRILLLFRFPHLAGSSECHAVLHPFGDLLLVPDDRARNQLDLLGEGPVVDTVIDEGLTHPRDLKDLWEAKEVGCCGFSWHQIPPFRLARRK